MKPGRSETSDSVFVEAVARRVVDLLREEAALSLDGPRLITVAQVAEEFGVSTDWLYANAQALGVIRLGSGPRARLRFDRDAIGVRIAKLASHRRQDVRGRSEQRRGRTKSNAGDDLLPIRDNLA